MQASLSRRKSTAYLVTLFTLEIEDKELSQKKDGSVSVDLTATSDILYGTATSLAKLLVHDQHICKCNFTLSIGTGPPKKITTFKKLCIQGIGIGNSTHKIL